MTAHKHTGRRKHVDFVVNATGSTDKISKIDSPLLRQLRGVPEWLFAILLWAEIGGVIGVVIARRGLPAAQLVRARYVD